MSGIVVPRNGIPLTNQERSNSASSIVLHQPVQKFQDVLSAATRLQKAATIPPAQNSSSHSSYTIQQGDTLSGIVAAESKKQGNNLSRQELYSMVNQVAELNHLASPDRILAGQKIDLTSISDAGTGPVAGSVSEPMIASPKLPDLPTTTMFQAPVSGKITSLFGMRNHPILGEALHHDGIDISQPAGTPVKPLTAGTVTFSGKNGGYGLLVEIDHGNGLTSRYAHLSKLLVHKGQQISPEQIIGQVGQTGLTTGPHLHLEIQRQNNPIDPLTVLNRRQVESNLVFAEARTTHRI